MLPSGGWNSAKIYGLQCWKFRKISRCNNPRHHFGSGLWWWWRRWYNNNDKKKNKNVIIVIIIIIIIIIIILSTPGKSEKELSVSKVLGARSTFQCHITSRQFTCLWLHRLIDRIHFVLSVIFKFPRDHIYRGLKNYNSNSRLIMILPNLCALPVEIHVAICPPVR